MGTLSIYEDKMGKTIKSLQNEFNTIRVGRASPSVLDRVSVDYYGAPTPIQQMAAVSVPEPKTLLIQPWDMSTLSSIERAIQAADLGLNPTNDGKVIRINFPPLTEDRRKEIVKRVHKYGEEAKVAIRSIRRDAMEAFKAQKKNSEITEDDLKNLEKDVQTLTDKFCKEVDKVSENKVKEIMEI